MLPAHLPPTVSLAEWKASMTKNRDLLAWFEARVAVPADESAWWRAAGEALGGPLTIVVLGEDWCPEVPREVATVEALANASGMTVRFIYRDQRREFADRYRKADGRNHIPTLIFFTHDGREIGHWLERAAATDAVLADLRAELLTGLTEEQQAERRPILLQRLAQAYVDGLWRESLAEWRAVVAPAVAEARAAIAAR
ncbi:MAG: thioredoxin family protein [Dehalococcoidia bacterium]|nr:thioredoxin family protein [Dehalococcoidia bacterium]